MMMMMMIYYYELFYGLPVVFFVCSLGEVKQAKHASSSLFGCTKGLQEANNRHASFNVRIFRSGRF